MYHIELEKCKRLTPSTSKSVHSFRSYDTSKTRDQNWSRKIIFFLSSFVDVAVLTCCLWSVLAPKRIDRFEFAWSLAFFQFYMIHVKKSKIDQEKAKLWGIKNCSTLSAPHCKEHPPLPLPATWLPLPNTRDYAGLCIRPCYVTVSLDKSRLWETQTQRERDTHTHT